MADQTNHVYWFGKFSKSCHGHTMTKEELVPKWCIGPKTAEKAFSHTHQAGTRHSNHPFSHQFSTGFNHNRWNRLKGAWYADVFFNK